MPNLVVHDGLTLRRPIEDGIHAVHESVQFRATKVTNAQKDEGRMLRNALGDNLLELLEALMRKRQVEVA